MESCCGTDHNRVHKDGLCPRCGSKGRPVPMITLKSLLKSLLKPFALERLNPKDSYFYCSDAACSVVYFEGDQVFTTWSYPGFVDSQK